MMYRRYRFPFAWREMERLQREMNRVFDAFYPSRLQAAPGYPAMNVWTDEEGLVVTAEVPGVNPEDIDISVVGDVLTLTGERKPDQVKEDARYHRQERGYGKFTRTLQLPFLVDADKVEATFKDGVLTISMVRAEADRPRRIKVVSA